MQHIQQHKLSDKAVDADVVRPLDPDSVVQGSMETDIENEDRSSSHVAQSTIPEPHSFFVSASLPPGQPGSVLVSVLHLERPLSLLSFLF